MRVMLFLAILGWSPAGRRWPQTTRPAAPSRRPQARPGCGVFGMILWAAAITSVIGAAYTSVSFMTRSKTPERTRNLMTVGFIVLSTVIFLLIEEAPVTLLTFAGTFNGLILPIGFGALLWVAWRRRDLLHGYRYPRGWRSSAPSPGCSRSTSATRRSSTSARSRRARPARPAPRRRPWGG